MKLRRVRRFTKRNIKKITGLIVKRGARVVTDGLGCFNGVADAGCAHEAIVTGSGRKAARHPAFKAVNTVLSNIKSAIAATFRSGNGKHAPRRLAEFERWRLLGLDTSETIYARCDAEYQAGILATKELEILIRTAKTVRPLADGGLDRYRRVLGRLYNRRAGCGGHHGEARLGQAL